MKQCCSLTNFGLPLSPFRKSCTRPWYCAIIISSGENLMRTVEKLMINKINRSLYLCFGGKIWVSKVNSPIHTTYFYTNHMHVMLSNNVMKNKIDNRKRFGNARVSFSRKEESGAASTVSPHRSRLQYNTIVTYHFFQRNFG